MTYGGLQGTYSDLMTGWEAELRGGAMNHSQRHQIRGAHPNCPECYPPVSRETIDRDFFRLAAQTYGYCTEKPRVSKVRNDHLDGQEERPWTVTNHELGFRTFVTWREAMDYALFHPVMM